MQLDNCLVSSQKIRNLRKVIVVYMTKYILCTLHASLVEFLNISYTYTYFPVHIHFFSPHDKLCHSVHDPFSRVGTFFSILQGEVGASD